MQKRGSMEEHGPLRKQGMVLERQTKKGSGMQGGPSWGMCAWFRFYLEELLVFCLTRSLINLPVGSVTYLNI